MHTAKNADNYLEEGEIVLLTLANSSAAACLVCGFSCRTGKMDIFKVN